MENETFGRGKQELALKEMDILRKRAEEFEGRLMAAVLAGSNRRIAGLRHNISDINAQIAYYESRISPTSE